MAESRTGWEWPTLSEEDSPRRSRLPGLVWPALFLFYLAQPIIEVLRTPNSVPYRLDVGGNTVVSGVG